MLIVTEPTARYAKTVAMGLLCIWIIAEQCGAEETFRNLVFKGAVWRYLDDGSDQSIAWQGVGFDDSSWKQGAGELGFGDGGEATVISQGVGADRHITYYFRNNFEVSAEDLGTYHYLRIDLRADDGAAVYVNGQLAVLSGLREGAAYDEPATTTVGDANEKAYFEHRAPLSMLVAGTNLIAVEVHQAGATSSDVSFDMRLRAMLQLYGAPVRIGSSLDGMFHAGSFTGPGATDALVTGHNFSPSRLIAGSKEGPTVSLMNFDGQFMDSADMNGDGADEILHRFPIDTGDSGDLILMAREVDSFVSQSVVIASGPGNKSGCLSDVDGDSIFPEEDDVHVADIARATSGVAMDADRDGLVDLVLNSQLEGVLFLRRLPIGAPAVTNFATSPVSLDAPGQIELRWDVKGVAEVQIQPEPGIVAAEGSASIAVTETTIFRVTTGSAAGAETVARVNPFRFAGLETVFPPDRADAPASMPVDVDGDGVEELLWVTGGQFDDFRQMVALTPSFEGRMEQRVLFDWPRGIFGEIAVKVNDFDSDGTLDLLIKLGSSWQLSMGRGAGQF
ncbi:MAG: hypothetical protein ACI9R3_006385, partial [Verrucomicrobiales bacterium]